MRMIILAIVALTTAEMTASVSAGPVPENCMSCICSVESGCQMPSPLCHNDGGSQSCGPYQIKNTYWQDARRKGGYLEGDWRKCAASFTCSENAVQGYMERYATLGRLGHNATCEDFARLHNGGLYGFQYSSTIGYWNRVQSCLNG